MIKQTLYVLRGLPYTGKTDHARAWVNENPEFRVRVNLEDVGMQMYGTLNMKSQMQIETVYALELAQIEVALKAHLSVVVDSVNLSDERINKWYKLALKYRVPVVVRDCEADLADILFEHACSDNVYMSEAVLRRMYKNFTNKGKLKSLPPKPETHELIVEPYEPDDSLPGAYIFDIDSTLAQMDRENPEGRSPFAYDRVDEDEVIENVARVARILGEHYPLLIMTGREEWCKDKSLEWLVSKANVPVKDIFMRRDGSNVSDDEEKLFLFNENVRGKYNVLGVFDDRLKVCRMWEQMGLTLFRVGPIDSDF